LLWRFCGVMECALGGGGVVVGGSEGVSGEGGKGEGR